MKLFYTLVFLSALQLSPINAEKLNHRNLDHRLKRQVTTPATHAPTPSTSTPSTPNPTTTSVPNSGLHPTSQTIPLTSTTGSGLSGTSTLSGVSTTLSTTTTGPPPLDTSTGTIPLNNITFGMPTRASLAVSSVYTPGATPPISGAPVLPTLLSVQTWPPQDKIPDTSSKEVQEWMKELDGFDIPDIPPTTDGSCASDPNVDSASRGWWTCGGYTRSTDITACPNYLTWGVSFDDGPSPNTQQLLNFLKQNDLRSTFFVVGSRVIERPDILIEEYMSGHELSVHTWSHPHLTSLPTEEVVAEFGWTRKAIKSVTGVTPTTMRPPFGDIDDRIRAISLAMGMVPIIWTSTPSGGKFDTNDWRVAGGTIPGNQSISTFDQILSNATTLETGFIVLQHDLFQITVDLAIYYTLIAAMNFQPKLTLQSIGQCIGQPPENLYLETTKNETFPYRNHTTSGGGVDVNGDGSDDGSGSASSSAGLIITIPIWSSLLTLGVGVVIGVLSI